jgi:hypothetical protein
LVGVFVGVLVGVFVGVLVRVLVGVFVGVGAPTDVTTEVVLSERSVSNSLEATLSRLVCDPLRVGVAVMVAVAEPPLDTFPMPHVTITGDPRPAQLTEQPPLGALPDTEEKLAGKISISVTFVAWPGPEFLTVIV